MRRAAERAGATGTPRMWRFVSGLADATHLAGEHYVHESTDVAPRHAAAPTRRAVTEAVDSPAPTPTVTSGTKREPPLPAAPMAPRQVSAPAPVVSTSVPISVSPVDETSRRVQKPIEEVFAELDRALAADPLGIAPPR